MNSLYRKKILNCTNFILSDVNKCHLSFGQTQSIYSNVCDWKSELTLAKNLLKSVIYANNSFIVFSKPWGLPIHSARSEPTSEISKRKRIHLEMGDSGARFVKSPIVLADTLGYIASACQVPRVYLAKPPHRLWSGVTVLTSSDSAVVQIDKSLRRAKASVLPHLRFYCITNGIMTPANGEERCGIELTELDELGEYKEPQYIPPDKIIGDRKKMIKNRIPEKHFKVANVRWKTLAANRELGVSLVELESTQSHWNFVQCFFAYKTAFLLGDQYFSRRVNHLMGVPVMSHPKKSQTVENILAAGSVPVDISNNLKKALKVRSHSDVPLMIHLAGMTFPQLARVQHRGPKIIPYPDWPKFEPPADSQDIVFNADSKEHLPPHFYHTLDALGLNIFQ